MKTKFKREEIINELAQLAGYELMPFGKMIRARERVKQLERELKQLENV